MRRVRVQGRGEVGVSQRRPVLSSPGVGAVVAVVQRSEERRLEGKREGGGVVEDAAVKVEGERF
jgi:hypothetical protein